ncbi:hypothetical protein L210DRAFT_140532 [Boletus edulis BED1]|uniref:Coatomer beta subunit C-terminal domain-containing protein n=1 Tax=Boletus edulis BED1 TaxID=1328754 RepID=A0AAD4GLC4_BOLED|nr:hypothetical protein L210DRAFT_140532 [Boletus edulis BED1]
MHGFDILLDVLVNKTLNTLQNLYLGFGTLGGLKLVELKSARVVSFLEASFGSGDMRDPGRHRHRHHGLIKPACCNEIQFRSI